MDTLERFESFIKVASDNQLNRCSDSIFKEQTMRMKFHIMRSYEQNNLRQNIMNACTLYGYENVMEIIKEIESEKTTGRCNKAVPEKEA